MFCCDAADEMLTCYLLPCILFERDPAVSDVGARLRGRACEPYVEVHWMFAPSSPSAFCRISEYVCVSKFRFWVDPYILNAFVHHKDCTTPGPEGGTGPRASFARPQLETQSIRVSTPSPACSRNVYLVVHSQQNATGLPRLRRPRRSSSTKSLRISRKRRRPLRN